MCIYIYIYVCVRMCLSGKAESCNGSVVKFIVQEEAVHSKELLPSAFIASLLYWQGQKNYTTFPDSIDCFFFLFFKWKFKMCTKAGNVIKWQDQTWSTAFATRVAWKKHKRWFNKDKAPQNTVHKYKEKVCVCAELPHSFPKNKCVQNGAELN